MTAKKCTKKYDALAELLFCKIKPIVFLPLSLPSPSSLLKLPIFFFGGGGGVRGRGVLVLYDCTVVLTKPKSEKHHYQH